MNWTGRFMDASLHPPTHPRRPKSGDGDPTWVLLENRAYITDTQNHTTAYCHTRDNTNKLQVTFFFAAPPLVSYFGMSFTDSKPTELGHEPWIAAADSNLVLIFSVHGSRHNIYDRRMHDFYIYQADGASDGGPSLKLLPHPTPGVFPSDSRYYFHHRQAGILRYRNERPARGLALCRHGPVPYDGYIIASLCLGKLDEVIDELPYKFDICTYDSKTETWSRQPAFLDKQQHLPERPPESERVITIREETGTMGWVDLWRGITVCDVLPDLEKKKSTPLLLRYIPLPPSILPNNRLNGPSSMYRDIAVVGGRVRYVELQMHIRPVSYNPGTFVSDGWTAVTWSMSAESLDKGWDRELEVHAHEVSTDAAVGFELLPELLDDKGTPQPTLERMHIGHPTLSLHQDDNTVYFMTKIDYKDHDAAWVIAVDMKNKKLQGVSRFAGAKRNRFFTEAYVHNSISGHLNMVQGIQGHLKRPGIPLSGSSSKKGPYTLLR